MATVNSNFNCINEKNLEQCVVTFLEKVDSMEKAKTQLARKSLPPAQNELKTLQLWRSVICECLASFLYVFIVCGAASTQASAGNFAQTSNVTAAASGFTICVLTYCFQNLSGAHINPAISLSMVVCRKITPLRGTLFVAAQSGGAIAGAALLYGVTVPTHYGNLNATVAQILPLMSPWERFSIEFVLAFLIVFTYCVTMNGHRKWLGNSAVCMGLAYLATGLVSMPTQNPIRAFGPAFVMNRWENHWVFWFGPCLGGVIAALVFEVIFITHQRKNRSDMSVDGDSASIRSEADTYDDFNKERSTVMRTVNPNPYTRQMPSNSGHGNSYYSGFYPMSICKTDRITEPLYEGSRSLYTRSPPPIRANLNRSQSVYTKTLSNHLQRRDQQTHTRLGNGIPMYQAAPSLYTTPPPPPPHSNMAVLNPINQNHQNQQRQGQNQNTAGESIYGTKLQQNNRDIYGKLATERHEYGYGNTTKKGQDSNDNTYNSYVSSSGGSSKISSNQTFRKDNRQQNSSLSPGVDNHHGSYYHSQSSPSSQY